MSNRVKIKQRYDNLNRNPKDQEKILLICGSFRQGEEAGNCGAQVVANLGVFRSVPVLAAGLNKVGWILAKAKTHEGDEVVNPLCGDCAAKLKAFLANER